MTADWIKHLEQSTNGRKLLEQERLIVEVTETIARLMEEQRVSRAELARKIEKTPAFITKLLNGDNNFTLRTLSDVAFAMDRSVHISLGEVGEGVLLCPVAAQTQLSLSLNGWKTKERARWPRAEPADLGEQTDGKDIAA